MDADTYINKTVDSYCSEFINITGHTPELTVDDYIAIRKEALWEYHYYRLGSHPYEDTKANTPAVMPKKPDPVENDISHNSLPSDTRPTEHNVYDKNQEKANIDEENQQVIDIFQMLGEE